MKHYSPLAICLLCCLLSLAACSTHPQVAAIDYADVDEEQLAGDRKECEAYADELYDEGYVVNTLLFSAFFAGAIEYIFSGGDEDFARGAALIGAMEGGIIGASDMAYEKAEIIKNCLHERGYIVLN